MLQTDLPLKIKMHTFISIVVAIITVAPLYYMSLLGWFSDGEASDDSDSTDDYGSF